MAVPRLRVEIDYEQLKKAGVDIPALFAKMGVSSEVTERKMRNTERALKAQEAAFNRLKSSLDPVFAAQQKYQRSVELLDDAFRRKLIKSQAEYNALLKAAKSQMTGSASGMSRLGGELRSMATSYVSAAAAVGLLVGALKASVREAIEAEKAYTRLDFVVGQNAARIGFSTDQLARFAGELQKGTAFDDEAIMGAMEALSRFAAVNGSNMQELTKLTLDYATVTGKDAVSAAQALGKALDEPGDSMRALKEIGVVLNRQEEERIDLLMKSGREWEAQAIILERVRKAVQGMAENDLKNASGQWQNFTNKVGELGEKLGNVFLWWVRINSLSKNSFWSSGGGTPTPQRAVVPLSEITSRSGSDALDAGAMEAASKRVIKALDDEAKAALKASKDFAAATKELGNLRIETLATVDPSERLYKAFGAEGFAGPDLSAYTRVQEILADSVSEVEKMSEIQSLLNYAVQKQWITEEQAAKALREQSEALGLVKEQTKDVADEWAKINEGFQERVGEALFDAADGFLRRMEYGLIKKLPTGIQSFAKALLDAANAWLIQMLSNIVKAKLAAKGIGEAGGGGGGGGGTGWIGTIAKLFKGGGSGGGAGGGTAMGTWGGIAIAAITVAAALYKMNQRKQHEEGGRRESFANLSMTGGDAYASGTGRLSGTAGQVANSMLDLFNALNDTARAGITSMDNVTVEISNNKKYFDAKINGILIGKFTSVEEATVRAVGYAFANATGDIDAVLRSSMKNFTGKSIDDMKKAAAMIQEVADAFNGISEVDAEIGAIAPKARALADELRNLGVAAMDASVTGLRAMVVGFRGVWDSLAGGEMSPKEQRERAERSRALLLAQMKLERAKLAADIKVLEIQSRIGRSSLLLKGAELRGETVYLRAQGKLWDAELDMASGYLQGRGQYVKAQGTLFNAELEAMQAVLIELDKLIGTVSIGKIKIGGGKKGGGGGGPSYQDRLLTAIERLINAVTALREFQESLKQDEALSPYSTQQRFFMARQSFNALASQAMSGNVAAIEQLPEAARLYLELAQQMFGTAGLGYGNIFEQVQALLEAISNQYPEGQDPQAWLKSDMEAVNRYLEILHLDGRRRKEQHDETNRRLRHQEELLQQIADGQQGANNTVAKILSTQRATPVRNGGMRAA